MAVVAPLRRQYRQRRWHVLVRPARIDREDAVAVAAARTGDRHGRCARHLIVSCMVFVRRRSDHEACSICRTGCIPSSTQITDFGKSGWFLWPLGILFLVLAALPPMASPVQQRVLAAIMVRVGFLFTAIAVPGLFDTIVKRLIGRARPFVGGHLDPFLFQPVRLARRTTPACRPAMPPPRSPCWSRSARSGRARAAIC